MKEKSINMPATTSVLVTPLILLAFVYYSISQISAPQARTFSAPPGEFSAIRAMEHVTMIAREPHPVGTPTHEEVRSYIVGKLKGLGLEPEIQTTTAVRQGRRPPVPAATVNNIAARLSGSGNSRALLLMGHYDSVPTSPGASDDAHSVAVMLEVLRALKTGPILKNDVIFLITDAEELGLLGARAFVDEHPWAKDVGLVLNFEARGTSGPAILFETGQENGWLIQEFARVVRHPIASSLASVVYRLMPNDTDLTIFKEAGYPGLNFAYIGNVTHYHTWLDNAKNIDARSLQHQGSYALSLIRHFGAADLADIRRPDHVYFNAVGTRVVHYPSQWAWQIAVALSLLFVSIVLLGVRRRILSIGGILSGLLVFIVSQCLVAALGFLAWWLILRFQDRFEAIYSGDNYIIGLIALSIAFFATFCNWFRVSLKTHNLAMGALLFWLILALLTSLFWPGASYVFTWPLAFSLLGLGVQIVTKTHSSASAVAFAWLILCSVPALLIVSPIIYLLYAALALPMAGVLMVSVLLLLGLLLPHLCLLCRPNRWWLPAVSTLIGIIFIYTAASRSGYDEDHRKPNSIFYGLNADSGEAFWGTIDKEPDEWTSQFFSSPPESASFDELLPTSTGNYLRHQAPALDLAHPSLEVLEDRSTDQQRTVRMHVTSPRGAPNCLVFIPSDTLIRSIQLNGRPLDLSYDESSIWFGRRSAGTSPIRWGMAYGNLPKDGIELTLEIVPDAPLEIRVVDFSYGLPEVPGLYIRARPGHMMPLPEWADRTFVAKSFKLEIR